VSGAYNAELDQWRAEARDCVRRWMGKDRESFNAFVAQLARDAAYRRPDGAIGLADAPFRATLAQLGLDAILTQLREERDTEGLFGGGE
jgi:hypothetical protein